MKSPVMIILASASPRRKELLTQLGLRFSVFPVDIDETPLPGEMAAEYVARLAAGKASAALERLDGKLPAQCYVVGSDTSVVRQDRILGKPENKSDFLAMMHSLSGNGHQVMSGISVIRIRAGHPPERQTQVVKTDVRFRNLTEDEMQAYWDTGEPLDKAGGYGIQGKGAILVDGIEGSYSNVVGLPLTELAAMLGQLGLDVWRFNPSDMDLPPGECRLDEWM